MGDPITAELHPPSASRVLVVIPAHNEAATIEAVVTEAVSRRPVLVVDDGSTDATARLARSAGAEVRCHDGNLGKGAALKTGFAWALERDFEAVVTIDGDGQHDPAEIDRLVEAARGQKDVLVIGERSFSDMPWPRWWSAPLGAWLLSRALGSRITDNQSGFRLLGRRLLERLELSSDGYEMEVEMIGEALRLGGPLVWVPIRTIYPPNRRPGFRPIVDSARFLRMVWQLGRRRRNGQLTA